MPWRETQDPYKILVSEVMLQQTQVDRVIPKYTAFIAAFPTVWDLAKAPLPRVLQLWSGLGYNRRALALQAAAQKIIKYYQGAIPADIEALDALPGIGKATASAIAAYAFNSPAVFVETNVRTVFIHFFFRDKTRIADRAVARLVFETLDRKNPREWYYALMDYGAMLKKTVGNPNIQSKTYAKQPRFEGSVRQLRGKALKFVMAKKMKAAELIAALAGDREVASRIVDDLVREGFFTRAGGYVSIRK